MFKPNLLAVTLDVSTFAFIIGQMIEYCEAVTVQKDVKGE